MGRLQFHIHKGSGSMAIEGKLDKRRFILEIIRNPIWLQGYLPQNSWANRKKLRGHLLPFQQLLPQISEGNRYGTEN